MSTLRINVFYNFLGIAFPLCTGVVVTPYLLHAMGVERFGILSMAWMLVGYFGIFDMGLGRALTRKIAERIGRGATGNLKSLIWATTAVAFTLGLAGAALILYNVAWLAHDFMKVSAAAGNELRNGCIWIALTIPFVLASTSLAGVLEGQQSFGVAGAIRAIVSMLTLCVPALSLHYTSGLDAVFFAIFLVRAAAFLVSAAIVTRCSRMYAGWAVDGTELRGLFRYGGWLTLSNIVSPLMVYFDRFYIASALGAAVVAYYATPSDLISKMLYLPLAVTGVMFASFATDWASNRDTVRRRFRKTFLAVGAMMVPPVLIALVFGRTLLGMWLDADFAARSYQVVQILSIGLLFNSLATVPFALIQASGRADITAKFHLLELPLYVALIYVLTNRYGLNGAAAAWTIRTCIDMLLLVSFARRSLAPERDTGNAR